MRTRHVGLRCTRCAAEFAAGSATGSGVGSAAGFDGRLFEGCPACRDGEWAANLVAAYDLTGARADWDRRAGRGLWRYRAFLPIGADQTPVTLGEGGTAAVRLAERAGWAQLWLKNESGNPTWSYKDRLNAVAV